MYCNNCGEKIKEGSDFCQNCGTKISNNGVQRNNSTNSFKNDRKIDNAKRVNKKTQIIIASVMICLIILNVVQFFHRSHKLDMYNELGVQTRDEIEKTDITIKKIKADEINIGDYITFGRYEQDNDLNNGAEDIEWRVIDIETSSNDGGNRILVISRYALDCLPYNEEYEDITWENCDLREWLNNDFYNGAFSKDEKNQIVLVNNDNPDASFFCESWEGKGGNDTFDNVFLLSFEQAENLFIDYDDRKCSPTDYAMWNGTHNISNHHCWWWLRSPGLKQHGAMHVNGGNLGDEEGVSCDFIGVRPALWIYLD